MAEFSIACPHCRQNLKVPEDMAGQVTECPSCNKQFSIPRIVPDESRFSADEMSCPSCGSRMKKEAQICLKCGVRPADVWAKGDANFCHACGNRINKGAKICLKCGVSVPDSVPANLNGKSWLTTLLLCIFVGCFGIHRFYSGHIGIGIVQLLTGGACGIWWLIDFILILTGAYKDSKGNPLNKQESFV